MEGLFPCSSKLQLEIEQYGFLRLMFWAALYIYFFPSFNRSNVCVEALAKCETIAPLKRAMNLRKDLIFAACETFSTIFQSHHDSLVKQVSGFKT